MSGEGVVVEPQRIPAALGFRVKSGLATVVLLSGPAAAPRVIDRRKIDLSDPAVPDSRQPFHAGFGTEQTDTRTITRLVQLIERCTRRSVAGVIRESRAKGCDLRGAGLVVGSEIDPQVVANPHIRAHASEGRLFRQVTEHALRQNGLPCSVWVERVLYTRAAQRLGRPEDQVKRVAADLGRGIVGAWRAEEKTAAVAAWLALIERRP